MNKQMIRLLAISIFISAAIMACSKKIAPESKDVNRTDQAKQAEQPVAEQKTEEAVVDPDAEKTKPPTTDPSTLPPSLPPPNAPKGPEKPSEEEMGRNIYTSSCNKCHKAKTVKNYTLVQWESILKVMVPNAKLSPEEESYLVAYIRANTK
jgi:hypothetical protein